MEIRNFSFDDIQLVQFVHFSSSMLSISSLGGVRRTSDIPPAEMIQLMELFRDLVFEDTGVEGRDEFLDDVGVLTLTRQILQIFILRL